MFLPVEVRACLSGFLVLCQLYMCLQWVKWHVLWFAGWSIPPYGLWHVHRPLFGCGKLATPCAVLLSQSEIPLLLLL